MAWQSEFTGGNKVYWVDNSGISVQPIGEFHEYYESSTFGKPGGKVVLKHTPNAIIDYVLGDSITIRRTSSNPNVAVGLIDGATYDVLDIFPYSGSMMTMLDLNWNSSNTGHAVTGYITNSASADDERDLWNVDASFTYNQNKNYQFITSVQGFKDDSVRYLELETPWGSKFEYKERLTPEENTMLALSHSGNIFHFSSPTTSLSSTDRVKYTSSFKGFGDMLNISGPIPAIKNIKVVETDWFVQGWAITNLPANEGWSLNVSTGVASYRPKVNSTNKRLSYGNNSNNNGHITVKENNYIARYIQYPTFNISFESTLGNDASSYFDMYLVEDIEGLNSSSYATILSQGQNLGKISESKSNKMFNLTGNQYIVFVANYNSTSSIVMRLENFSIDGSYHEIDNNKQFLLTNSADYSEPTDLCIIGGSSDATYSVLVSNENTIHVTGPSGSESSFGPTGNPGFFSTTYGIIENLNALSAKVGNGTFKAGVWENGVWNSGWRVDDSVCEFDDVQISLLMRTRNDKWRIQISGPQSSLDNFEIGDRVSIGNIVGIDINESRKLMTNYFTVLSVNNGNMVVDFNNTFPLRRIEKDSPNHKIKITKNVWLSGGFLNGYFEGVWNAGLFKGFPFITEMYNSHWIDGKFDGGHFYGEYPEVKFIDTIWNQSTSPNTLGLTFGSVYHNLEVGDEITIEKDNSSVNPQYNGDATVIAVIDPHMIVINKPFGSSTNMEGGLIKRRTGTGVVQHFEFYDNNVGESILSTGNNNLRNIYKYNSWMDIKYLDESASNLGRDLVSWDPDIGEYSENNLYGYITNDILSSISSFRNSNNMDKSIYSLGTKYKIYEDYIGDASEFNEPFNNVSALGMNNFYDNGWTFSTTDNNTQIKREVAETLSIELNQSNTSSRFTLDNTKISIEKKRYSMIELDMIKLESSNNIYKFGNKPIFYLNNNIFSGSSPLFPIGNNVYHRDTKKMKKYEYFFNRRSLSISLLKNNLVNPKTGNIDIEMDNLKFYEIDMIPFFQYATEDYINKSIQVPYKGVAPFIDYEDNQFSFIDNISIGLDSLLTQQSSSDVYIDPIISQGGVITSL